MWEPEPGWEDLSRGISSSTVGVWRVHDDEGDWVVKRLAAPTIDDALELSRETHYGWWHREIEVAQAPALPAGSGLVRPRVRRVVEDVDGATLWTSYVEPEPLPGPYAARALGRFAAQPLEPEPWWCRNLLTDRLARSEERGGWPTLARTTVADLADALWTRRRGLLERYDALPAGPSHGDPAPGNLLAQQGEDVLAVDWRMFGTAPHGADLGYYALSCREDFEVLVDAWLTGHAEGGGKATRDDLLLAARVMAVFTVVSQAEWALARVAVGEGALASKYRHPSVAPYLRALQRQFPQIEALLG